MSRRLNAPLLASLFLVALFAPAAASADRTAAVTVEVPATAPLGSPVALAVRLPVSAAAIDGRVLVHRGSAEVIGVAPVGAGTALRPVEIDGGVAFGAYGLRGSGRHTVLRIVIVPLRAGRLEARVVVDAAADGAGRRLALTGRERLASTRVGGGTRQLSAPAVSGRPAPDRAARATRDARPDGRIDTADVNVVRAAWETARAVGTTCGPAIARDRELADADVNGDGCVDIVDAQAISSARGRRLGGATVAPSATAPALAGLTFTVTNASDTADAAPGNGTCADSLGRCTLRAAMMEADTRAGDDRIHFNLTGTAPVLIQLGSTRLPIITSGNGTLVIDGYTQPGSRVNDAAVGSNAIPGVEVRGNGNSAREIVFRIFSGNNTIRGVLIHNVWRSVVLDTANATGNRIVGNFIGFRRDGTLSDKGVHAVVANTGAHHNVIGTPTLADRNVIGNHAHAIQMYGPGTDGNVVQNNVLCMRPSGLSGATCDVGIDHNFGPKNGLIGGTGVNQRNMVGPTNNQCVEYSHGWDPAGVDTTTKWQINGNRLIGNWLGFRADGSYDLSFRCGQREPTEDNAQGVNVYDGANDNVVEGNHIGSEYDGVQLMSGNAKRNIVRGNIIGVSPLGGAAPLTRWGIVVRGGTTLDVIEGNTIRNAPSGGIQLPDRNSAGEPSNVARNIRLSRNIVSDTSGHAIDLLPGTGPNANDPGDADSGANTLLNTPVFTTATTTTISGTAASGSTVEVFRASRSAGQYGLPTAFLGATVVATNGTWSLGLSPALAVGDRVTALQIRPSGHTSELAANVAVTNSPTPVPGELLAADDFERTVTGGWGSATPGGTWALTGTAADFSVSGGRGRVSVAAGQVREATLAVAAADVVITGRVSFDRVPDTGNAFAYVVARANGTSAYRAQVRLNNTGGIRLMLRKVVNGVDSALGAEVAPTVSGAGGAQIAFRFEVVGNQLRARVWAAGGTEPTTWQVAETDSSSPITAPGAAGLRTYAAQAMTNGPVLITLDELRVRRP